MDDYEKAGAEEWNLNRRASPEGDPIAATSLGQARPRTHLEHGYGQTTSYGATDGRQTSNQRPITNNEPKPRRIGTRERRAAPPRRSAWTVAEGVRRREQPQQEPQTLIDVVDNAAEAAWRTLQVPLATTQVPEELVWRDQEHEAIARKFGTYVAVVAGDRARDRAEIRFGIWGEADAVRHTLQAIRDWVSREAPSKNTLGINKFSKQRSLLPQQRYSEEKKWIQEVTRQRFRQFPAPLSTFGAIGTFHWPVKEYPPHEILGNSYEALDPIRMDCSCYVVFEPNISALQVMGEDRAVKAALLRIRKACFQVAAQRIAPVRRYILDFGDAGSDVPSHVALEPYERVQRMEPGVSIAQESSHRSPRSEGGSESNIFQQHMLDTSTRDINVAGKTIMLMIAKLHYYRGHLRFRIRLGNFLATSYRATDDGKYTIEDFKDMLQQSQFAAEVTSEIGRRSSETAALESLRDADHLLDPRISMDQTLFDVKPVYTAVFVFADKAGDLRLEMSWHEEGRKPGSKKGDVIELSRIWTRLNRGSTGPSSLVDISLVNLNESSAWHFNLSASHAVENKRLAPEYHNIADSIRVDIQVARQQRTDKPFVRWNPYVSIKTLQQRTSYLFALKNSNYTLELTRFQDRVFTHRHRTFNEVVCELYEPRWSLEVYHSTWDTLLTRNEHLQVGKSADWDAGVQTWFPENDALRDLEQIKGERGFEQLVLKLGLVERLVLESRSETHGGMEVG